jgi:ribosomal protein S18 acetylase RimI-like enzyme
LAILHGEDTVRDSPIGSDARFWSGRLGFESLSRSMHGDEVVVRSCDLADAAAVLQVWAAARTEHAVTTDRLMDVERLVNQTPGSLLVAELDGEIVGTLIAAWDGWRGNLYRLAVIDAHRRRGIAIKLVRAGEQRLRDIGAQRVTALVAYGDPVADAFWNAAGYPLDLDIGRRVSNI